MKTKFEYKINITTILLIVIGVVLFFGFFNRTNNNLKREIKTQQKLTRALMDTMRITKNMYGEVVATKLTLQGDINDILSSNIALTQTQRTLLNRVNSLKRDTDIISAALVSTNFKIDSLVSGYNVFVDNINNTVNFSDSTETLVYDITITNVAPVLPTIEPMLLFNDFTAPNESFIEFNWDKNRRENYPVSFSVTNSNELFQTVNIESYAIPELDKETVKPKRWTRFKTFIGEYGTYVIIGGIVYLVATR